MKEVTNENFNEFINSPNLSVLKAGAEYCMPCKSVALILDKVSKVIDNVNFGDIDIESQIELATSLGIRSIPTTFFYKNGEKIKTFVGSYTDSQLREMIEESNKIAI